MSSGTVTRAGPAETVRFTAEPLSTFVAATGSCIRTVPAAALVSSVDTVPNCNPAVCNDCVAAV